MQPHWDHVLKCHGLIKTDFVRGEGCYLYDSNDRRYVDFEAGIWCAALGHGHPAIVEAIRRQTERIMHLGVGYVSPLAEEAAVAALGTIPAELDRCAFLSSGSEAVEFGVQAMRRATGRELLLTFSPSYLGAYGSAGTVDPKEWHCVSLDACSSCSDGCGPECGVLSDIPFERVGGLVLEPGNSHGTVRFPPRPLVDLLVSGVRDSGGLIMANEVTTGFGRTGAWHGHEHYGLRPDVVALGKGLGNGYPVSAVAMTDELAGRLWDSGLRYVQSHQNDPLGCAVAIEVIRVLREEGLIEHSRDVGNRFRQELEALGAECDSIKEVRGQGLMIAVEFEALGERNLGMLLQQDLLERGFLVGTSSALSLLRFYPPLTVGEDEIDRLVANLGNALKNVRSDLN